MSSPWADARFATRVATDPVVQRLMTVPGIGPITASAFVAALDDVHRFGSSRGAARVASYLGLVPREHSSGEQQRRGRVLRSAHPYVQGLLVEAAGRTWRSAAGTLRSATGCCPISTQSRSRMRARATH